MAHRGALWAWLWSADSSFRSSLRFTSPQRFISHSKSSRKRSWIEPASSGPRATVCRRPRTPSRALFRMTDGSRESRAKAASSLAGAPSKRVSRFTLSREPSGTWRRLTVVIFTLSIAFLTGCTVGPKYARPSAAAAPAYKELTPANFKDTDGWKQAQPNDGTLKGNWWEIFNDAQLNALEEQVNVSNQNIAAAAANFLAARALVRQTRAQYYPTVTANPTITNSRPSLGQFGGVRTGTFSTSA